MTVSLISLFSLRIFLYFWFSYLYYFMAYLISIRISFFWCIWTFVSSLQSGTALITNSSFRYSKLMTAPLPIIYIPAHAMELSIEFKVFLWDELLIALSSSFFLRRHGYYFKSIEHLPSSPQIPSKALALCLCPRVCLSREILFDLSQSQDL